MKYVIQIIVISFSLSANGQNFKAQYKITHSFDIRITDNKSISTSVNFAGYFYKSGSSHIFYSKPLYLSNYPKGVISGSDGLGKYYTYSLVMDSIQKIDYNNTDSLICRISMEQSEPTTTEYFVQKFALGIHEWELLNETTEIGGLKCQRAKLYRDRNKTELIWDIWFCPDININFGPYFTRDLPGLMVKGEFFGEGNSYLCELESFSTPDSISSEVFWPEPFSKALFKELPPLKKRIPKPTKPK